MAIGLDVISIIVFFTAVGILLLIDRKNIEFHYGLIIRRWKRGQYVIDKFVNSHKKFLSYVGLAAIIVGVIAAIGGLYSIIHFSISLRQAVAPILPTAGGFEYPAQIIGVPFWFWLIAIFVLITAHEPMHAIFARLSKIPVKSWGIMTFLVIPVGAFVDPVMKKVDKLKTREKLQIFAAGSFGNFIVAAVVFLILITLNSFLFEPSGVIFANTINGTAADEVGLQGVIKNIDGTEIRTSQDINLALAQIPPGTEINIETNEGQYVLETEAVPRGGEGSYIGISRVGTFIDVKENLQQYRTSIITLRDLFFWLFIFNAGVGIFNMLPMKPFDGGLFFEEVFTRIFKSREKGRRAINITSIIVLIIILFNIFGTRAIGTFI